MRVTQGTFSFLPDLTDKQIEAQIKYMVSNHWAVSIEYTDNPHPRNAYWELWGIPCINASGVFVQASSQPNSVWKSQTTQFQRICNALLLRKVC